MSNNLIPRIDFAVLVGSDASAAQAELEKVADAATNSGFMILYNTEIDKEHVELVMDTYRSFFSLPAELKESVNMAATGSNRGWGAPYSEQVNAEANPDYKQVFDSGFEISSDDAYVLDQVPYYGPNMWPIEQPQMQITLNAYYQSATSLALKVLSKIAAAIGEPEDYFAASFDKPMSLLRGNYYPARPATAGDKDHGIAAHTDYGCLTLLATDGTPGLEVLAGDSVTWVPIITEPGEYVINFGDMMQFWTDGRVKATLHRVVGTNAQRISVPFFFNPNYFTNVAPPTSGATILAGEHLAKRFDSTYVHKQATVDV